MHLTIILRNRAEKNQGIFRKIEQNIFLIIQQILIVYYFHHKKNFSCMIKTPKACSK